MDEDSFRPGVSHNRPAHARSPFADGLRRRDNPAERTGRSMASRKSERVATGGIFADPELKIWSREGDHHHGDGMRLAPPVEPASDIWLRIGRYLLYACAFVGGWHLLRVGGQNITLSDVAFLACFAVMLGNGRLSVSPFGGASSLWYLAVGTMLLGLFASTALNGDLSRWLVVAVQYTLALCLIPMLLNSYPRDITARLPLIFCLGVVVSQLIGIVSINLFSYAQTSILLGTKFISGSGRLGALAGEANWNGASIASAMPMLIYSLVRGHIRVVPAVLCAIILAWGLLLSASFTGFCATLLSTLIALFLLGPKYVARLALVVAVGGGLFVAAGAPLPETFQKRVAGAITSGDLDQAGTFTGRAELIKEAWIMAEDTTLIGLGVDRFREESMHGAPVHQLYLLVWTEGGFIAFVGLLSILGLLIALGINAVRIDRVGGAMATGVIAVLLVYTFTSAHMYARLWMMPVMVALSAVYARRSEADDAETLSPVRR